MDFFCHLSYTWAVITPVCHMYVVGAGFSNTSVFMCSTTGLPSFELLDSMFHMMSSMNL